MNKYQLDNTPAPRSVVQQQACSPLDVVQEWNRIASTIQVNHGFCYWGPPRVKLADAVGLELIIRSDYFMANLYPKIEMALDDYNECGDLDEMPKSKLPLPAAIKAIYAHARALEGKEQKDDVDGPLACALRRSAQRLKAWANAKGEARADNAAPLPPTTF